MTLLAVDYAVIVFYLIATLILGLWAGRRERNAEDYFLAGRALPWYLIGFSFFASNMSGASFVGLMGASYAHGLVVFNYEWTATLVLTIFAIFILPVFLRNRIFTVPEYLGLRFDRRARWAYALFTLFALLFIDTAGALYAGAIVIATVFPTINLWYACLFMAVFSGAYTIFGGLRAVVLTDALQAIVMIAGAFVLAIYGLQAVGGWDMLIAKIEVSKSELMKPIDDDFLPWPGILGVVLLGFYYWSFNQYFVQRALAAKSLEHGRKGALFGGLLKLPNVMLMVIPGMVAAVLYPALASPDQAFPKLAFELLPIGLRGMLLAALLAAIMSSLDSALNAAASIVTMDFVKPLRPRTSDASLLWIGRLVTTIVMIVAALYAPLIAGFGSLFEYFQATLAYLVPPIVAIYLGGLATRKFARASAFWSIVITLPIGLLLFLTKEVFGAWSQMGLPDIHFTYVAVVMFALALSIMTVVSIFSTTDIPESVQEFTFLRSDLDPQHGSSQYQFLADYRIQAALLIALMLGLIVYLMR